MQLISARRESESKEHITIRVNRKDDEMDSDDTSPVRTDRRARHSEKRRRSRDRSESDSEDEHRPRRRQYSVNQVQPTPMYVQPQYSMPAIVPAPVPAAPPRMYGAPTPGPQGVFQNILHSILKQNIDERLNVSRRNRMWTEIRGNVLNEGHIINRNTANGSASTTTAHGTSAKLRLQLLHAACCWRASAAVVYR